MPPTGDTDADPFTRDREWDGNAKTAQRRDAVAVGGEGIDLDVGGAKAGQLTFNSSTSKTSVAFGGMTPPAPCDP